MIAKSAIGFRSPISGKALQRFYSRVRLGSRIEPGTLGQHRAAHILETVDRDLQGVGLVTMPHIRTMAVDALCQEETIRIRLTTITAKQRTNLAPVPVGFSLIFCTCVAIVPLNAEYVFKPSSPKAKKIAQQARHCHATTLHWCYRADTAKPWPP